MFSSKRKMVASALIVTTKAMWMFSFINQKMLKMGWTNYIRRKSCRLKMPHPHHHRHLHLSSALSCLLTLLLNTMLFLVLPPSIPQTTFFCFGASSPELVRQIYRTMVHTILNDDPCPLADEPKRDFVEMQNMAKLDAAGEKVPVTQEDIREIFESSITRFHLGDRWRNKEDDLTTSEWRNVYPSYMHENPAGADKSPARTQFHRLRQGKNRNVCAKRGTAAEERPPTTKCGPTAHHFLDAFEVFLDNGRSGQTKIVLLLDPLDMTSVREMWWNPDEDKELHEYQNPQLIGTLEAEFIDAAGKPVELRERKSSADPSSRSA
ncbi:unnamed protein product [Amoebophrya sp. A25]|nr:unnamed protein product [Amoebophrya sp. A25]|eukprot:GSA25T00026677001.1